MTGIAKTPLELVCAERQAALSLYLGEWRKAHDLLMGRARRYFEVYVSPTLIEVLQRLIYTKIDDRNGNPAEILQSAAGLEETTKYLQRELDAHVEKNRAKIKSLGLVPFLTDLLATHANTCPVCGQPCKIQGSVEDLALYGDAEFECGCPKPGGWDHHALDKSKFPRVVQDIITFERLGTARDKMINTRLTNSGKAIELVRISVDGRVVARIVALQFNIRSIPGIIVDRGMLSDTRHDGKVEVTDVWTKTFKDFEDTQYENALQQMRDGEALRLWFKWDERHRNWSATVTMDGVLNVYVLPSSVVVKSETSYICKILHEVTKARKEHFKLHYVQVLVAWREVQRTPVQKSRPPSRQPQRKSEIWLAEGKMGTFGDLLGRDLKRR